MEKLEYQSPSVEIISIDFNLAILEGSPNVVEEPVIVGPGEIIIE